MRFSRTSVVLVAVAAATLGSAIAAHGQDAAVDVQDNTFVPSEVTITAGDTVTWTQSGSNPHSVTADDGSFDSHPDCGGGGDCMGAGDEFAHTFDTEGTFAYYCRIHGAPGGVGMAGTVTVEAAGAEPSPTASPTPEPSPEPTETETAPDVTGSMTVSDQTGDGTSVTVDNVSISGGDGFVVVHADTDGAPGPVLGHAPLPEGSHSNFAVTLDQPLTESQTVWPMLHVDAGVEGTYEFPGPDGPVMDADGVITRSLVFTLQAAEDTVPDDTTPAEESIPATGTPLLPIAAVALLVLAAGSVATRVSRR